jgi:methionyl-tRNA synthetase
MTEPAAVPPSNTISFDDFAKVQLRVARVLEAKDHPNADKLIVIKVDLGGEQRQICAGIKGHYTPEQLVGRDIIIVANLAPRMMRGLESQGMLLAATSADRSRVVVLSPESPMEPGSIVS